MNTTLSPSDPSPLEKVAKPVRPKRCEGGGRLPAEAISAQAGDEVAYASPQEVIYRQTIYKESYR